MSTTYKKSRRPYEFAYDDYANFLEGIKLFATDHSSDPDFYPNYSLIPSLINDFQAKWQTYVSAQEAEDEANDQFHDVALSNLRDALIGLRRLLPALFDDDSMLAAFGIKQEIQTDVDKLILQAEICHDHWAELCDPDVPPEYGPVADKLDAVSVLLDTLLDSRQTYAEETRDREIAQNALGDSREAINHEERRMFNWYRGLYTDSEDEWWTETPWGKSGGGEEPSAPDWPDWPGPVEGSAEQIDEGLVRITHSGLNGGKTLLLERLKHGEVEYVIVTDGLPIDDPEDLTTFDDNHLEKGTYTYKLTPFDEAGNPGVPLEIDITVI